MNLNTGRALPLRPVPRFSFGQLACTGLVACLVLSAAPSGAAAAGIAKPSYYQRALDDFHQGNLTAALALLEKTPGAEPNADAEADIVNLRGAIYLRQHKYTEARAMFAKAAALDPGLWAARFNLAEVDFREKKYAASQEEFDALLRHTSRLRQRDERGFVEYKEQLAALLAGHEEPAIRAVADHRRDAKPSLAYFYLNAALAYHRGNAEQAETWLEQAGKMYSPVAEQVFAESFEQAGWSSGHAERTIAAGERNRAHTLPALGPSASPMVAALYRTTQQPGLPVVSTNAGTNPTRGSQPTLAVVQLMPQQSSVARSDRSAPDSEGEKPVFRYDEPPPDEDASVPPPAFAEGISETDRPGLSGPEVMARKKPAPTPSPSPSPTATPEASPDAAMQVQPSASASASPAATASPGADASPAAQTSPAVPAGTPEPTKPAFVEKYEAAYVKYLEKDYPGAQALLDQADAAQANQADSANLRGLIFSRLRNFEQAEAMFKRAIQIDPSFWAAKFNLAELPFTYKNYTEARRRFEELFSQTDASRQPREAELTQFKVFLTLLLEGKEAAARAFMQRFNFSGATPARYYCQAALDFYYGNVDKGVNWISSAKKEYPAQIEAIFAESFYRVGWLTDPNAPAAPTGMPGASPHAGEAPGVVVVQSSPAAAPTPPLAAVPGPSAPAIAAATPSTAKLPSATPVPSAAASVAQAEASAAPVVAPPAVAMSSPPVEALTPGQEATPSSGSSEPPEGSPASALESAAAPGTSSRSQAIRWLFAVAVLGQCAYMWFSQVAAARKRKSRLARHSLRYSGGRLAEREPHELEAP